jgi:hypothetical protein
MENITTTSELKFAIEELETVQFYQGQLLKEQLYDTLEMLKPINLLKSAFANFSSKPVFSGSILGSVAGLATGFLMRQLIVGVSGSIIRKMLGTIVQIGVTNFVFKKYEGVKKLGNSFFRRVFHKNKEISEKAEQRVIDIN